MLALDKGVFEQEEGVLVTWKQTPSDSNVIFVPAWPATGRPQQRGIQVSGRGHRGAAQRAGTQRRVYPETEAPHRSPVAGLRWRAAQARDATRGEPGGAATRGVGQE